MCRKKVGLTGKYHMSVMKTCKTKAACDENINSNLIVKFEWPAAARGAVVITYTSMSYMLLFQMPLQNWFLQESYRKKNIVKNQRYFHLPPNLAHTK